MSATSGYIVVPIESDPDALDADVIASIEAAFAGWDGTQGDFVARLVTGMCSMAAELRTVASDVPDAIFRYAGKTLFGIPPIDSTQATTTVTITVQDDAGYTIPAGTAVALSAADASQVGFATTIDTVIAPGDTSASGVLVQAIQAGAAGSDLSGTVTLVTSLAFITTITCEATSTGGVDAEDDDAYLARLRADLQLLAPRPILPGDFEVFARNIAGVASALALDGYQPSHNLLTVNQASVETDLTGFETGTNCTVTDSTTFALDGTHSLKLSSTASGDMSVQTSHGTGGVPVTPGQIYTALASFRSAVSARSALASIRWYTSGGTFISESDGAGTNDATGSFAQRIVAAAAPATAAFAAVLATVKATGGSTEIHYVDCLALRQGTDTTWVAGGTPATGNERTVTVVLRDAAGNPVSSGVKSAVQDDLESRREVNFLIPVIDPTYTTVNVAYTAVCDPAYATADVETAVDAAVAAWLDPAGWGAPQGGDAAGWIDTPTVRLFSLAQVIENVQGVLYASAVTINTVAADLVMSGPGALPTVGTVSGTVTAAP